MLVEITCKDTIPGGIRRFFPDLPLGTEQWNPSDFCIFLFRIFNDCAVGWMEVMAISAGLD